MKPRKQFQDGLAGSKEPTVRKSLTWLPASALTMHQPVPFQASPLSELPKRLRLLDKLLDETGAGRIVAKPVNPISIELVPLNPDKQ